MGLDMYLTKEHYIGGNYDHAGAVGSVDIKLADGTHLKLDAKQVGSVVEPFGYWRKANAIHKWFVDNVQEGVDECQRSYVTLEKLKELRDLCKDAIKRKRSGKLPPTSGFFFGSTEVDEYYWEDLKYTAKLLKDLPEEGSYRISYYYQASW